MKNNKLGFVSIEYVIVGAIVFFAFSVFAVRFIESSNTRVDVIRDQVGDKNPMIDEGVPTPPQSKDGCFIVDSGGVILSYDSSCGKQVVIPSHINGQQITAIGSGAFQGKGLTSIKIPDGIATVGDYAFQGNSLKSVVLPDSVISVGDFAFSNNALTSFYIPPMATYVGIGVVNNNLLPDSLAFVYSQDFNGINKGNIVSYGGAAKNVPVPYGVVTISRDAFYETGIQSVILPVTVSTIMDYAFASNSLRSVVFQGSRPLTLGSYIFFGNTGLTASTIRVPSAHLTDYRAYALSNFSVPSNVFYN